MNEERLSECPECGGTMVFSPDGRAQECERCGFRNELKFLEKDSIAELYKALRFMGVGIHTIDAELGDSTQRRVHRDMLAQGISAVKQKKKDEAYFHLSRVLKATNSHEEERLTAWFWPLTAHGRRVRSAV